MKKNEYLLWEKGIPETEPENRPGEDYKEEWYRSREVVRNVTVPTIRLFPPVKGVRRTRAGVVICPGGGYNVLEIDKEGYKIAKALSKWGSSPLCSSIVITLMTLLCRTHTAQSDT